MAFAPSAVYPIRQGGAFIEKDHGNLFEYDLVPADHSTGGHAASVSGYPHRVWVSENPVNDSGWRYALVKKTVVYIVTDEDESGQPVVQKWSIKAHRIYSN
tara:strand:+ start:100 stop:402 length:303 start_codon:yes stop_codon:yes gene_type:complete